MSRNFWYWAHRGAAEAAQRLPPSVSAPASRLIGGLFHRFSGNRRAIRARHLERALGRHLGRAELEEWLATSFRAYGRYWLEVLSTGGFTREYLNTVLDLPERHYIDDALAEGHGCVLALAHLGNWDLAGAWGAMQGYRMTSVAEVLEPPELFEFFCEQRRLLGITIYPLDGTSLAARSLLSDLREGAVVALLADRDIHGDGVAVTFFGEETTVPGGPAALALRTGAPLIAAGIYALDSQRYRGVLRPVARPDGVKGRAAIQQMTQELIFELERLIRLSPAEWHLYQPNWPSDHKALRAPVYVR